ncbi:hypothetical protein DXG01_001091 [Tephrocybe rancida]|nr:hypothetical protein DXG01_001091 [Tephrocybe rancida]
MIDCVTVIITFKLLDEDWASVDTKDILAQLFSLEKEPTPWHTIPALKHLLSAWEKKKDPWFAIYVDLLDAGLDKLNYIEMAWGGAKEQEAERQAGNPNAKNWQDEALNIVENTAAAPQEPAAMSSTSTQDAYDFNLCCQALLTWDDKGWQAELQQYLKDVPTDVTRGTNLIECWQGKKLKQLQIMKFAWHNNITDLVALNSKHIEDVNIKQFEELLEMNCEYEEWDKEEIFILNNKMGLC